MKLSEVEVDKLVQELARQRALWIKSAVDEGRKHTESEKTVISILHALENVLRPFKGVSE